MHLRLKWTCLVLALAALPELPANNTANLIVNGGFETQTAGRPTEWAYLNSGWTHVFCDESEKREGRFALCIAQRDEGKWRMAVSPIRGWKPGAQYELSWWGKSDGAAAGQVWICGHSKEGKVTGAAQEAKRLHGSGFSAKDWTRYSLRFAGPAYWKHLSLIVGHAKARSVGRVWIDDVTVAEVAPAAAPRVVKRANLLQNGDFEFGFDHWTSLHGLVSQVFALDPTDRARGLCSVRTANLDRWSKNTLRSYAMPVEHGREYVFAATMKAAKKNARVVLEVRGTAAPWDVNQEAKAQKTVTVAKKTFALGAQWQTCEMRARVPKSYPYPAVTVDIGLEASQGDVWMDDCYFGTEPRGAPEPCELAGIEIVSPSFGNVFRPHAPAVIRLRGVNSATTAAALAVSLRVEDDLGGRVPGQSLRLTVQPSSRGPWQAIRLDTSRRGHFRLIAEVDDAQGQPLSTQTLDYAVFAPVAGEGFDDDSFFGIVGARGMDPFWNNAPSYSGEVLSLLRDLGVRWVREWFPWNAIEPQEGEFHWASHDALVKDCHEHHLRLVGTILRYYAPNNHWQGGARFGLPGDLAKFKRSFTEIVRRYRDGVWGWEVWNEPAYFAEAAAYADTVRAAWEAAKAVDPKIKILAPSLVKPSHPARLEAWVKTVFEKARDCVDVVTLHSYCRGLEWYEPDNPLAQTLKEMGLAGRYPVWNSEWGMQSSSEWFADRSDEDILTTMTRTYLKCISAGQQRYFWFCAVPAVWDGYSVFYDRFVPRPNLIAQAWMAEMLARAVPAGHSTANDLEVHRYTTPSGAVAAFWFNGSRQAVMDMRTAKTAVGTDAEFFDIFGNPLARHVAISPIPVYARAKSLPDAQQLLDALSAAAKAPPPETR